MIIEFTAEIWYWRGPAPHFFLTVPPEQAEILNAIVDEVTYGWGMIPVHCRINQTEFQTSLFPKDGGYIVPLKQAVRQAEGLEKGDTVAIRLEVRG
jgi:hypothetical protein